MTGMSQNFSSGKVPSYSGTLFRLFLGKAESFEFCMIPGENFWGNSIAYELDTWAP